MADLDDHVTADFLAELLGIKPRAVRQLAADGVLERAERGRYKLASVARYVEQLRETAAGRASDGPLDLGQERAALARAQRERVEHDLALRRGRYVDVEAVGDAMVVVYTSVRDRLLRLGQRVAPKLAGMAAIGEIAALVNDEAAEILEEIADAGAASLDAAVRDARGSA